MNSKPAGGTLFDSIDMKSPDVPTPGTGGGSKSATHTPPKVAQESPPAVLPPCRRSVPTSVAAAVSVQRFTGTQRGRVLRYLKTRPTGATREEIVAATGLREASVCARLAELQGRYGNELCVKEIGTRPASSGRPVKVYTAI